MRRFALLGSVVLCVYGPISALAIPPEFGVLQMSVTSPTNSPTSPNLAGSDIAPTPTGRGYYIALANGAVAPFGDARTVGDAAGLRLNAPIVSIAVSPSGRRYWLAAADGGVFALGDAAFLGSMAGRRLAAPVRSISATPTGRGYWLVAADGGVFSFGDASYLGGGGVM